MLKEHCVAQKVAKWLEQEEKFCELILAPDGHLFVDADFESRADWFLLYQNGNLFARPSGNLFSFGIRPRSCITYPIYVGEATLYANSESDCVLRSDEPVLNQDVTVFAVFQFDDMLGMYTADTTLSRKIHFRAIANTPKNRDYVLEAFFEQLDRHEPALSEMAVSWLLAHFSPLEGF